MSTDDGSQDEPKLGGTANQQHSELSIIDNDDSRPKTQLRDIADSDDGTIESSSTNSHCVDLRHSDDRTLESTSPRTHSGSNFCVMGDESIGFDTFRHSYGLFSSTSISVLDCHYGVNNIPWNKPVIISNNNIDDICWKKYYSVIHSNFFLVIKGPPKIGCTQVGPNERPLNHERWKA